MASALPVCLVALPDALPQETIPRFKRLCATRSRGCHTTRELAVCLAVERSPRRCLGSYGPAVSLDLTCVFRHPHLSLCLCVLHIYEIVCACASVCPVHTMRALLSCRLSLALSLTCFLSLHPSPPVCPLARHNATRAGTPFGRTCSGEPQSRVPTSD